MRGDGWRRACRHTRRAICICDSPIAGLVCLCLAEGWQTPLCARAQTCWTYTHLATDEAVAETDLAHKIGEGHGGVRDLEDFVQREDRDPHQPNDSLGLLAMPHVCVVLCKRA